MKKIIVILSILFIVSICQAQRFHNSTSKGRYPFTAEEEIAQDSKEIVWAENAVIEAEKQAEKALIKAEEKEILKQQAIDSLKGKGWNPKHY